MKSILFTISKNDLIKSAIMAAIGAVLGAVDSGIKTHTLAFTLAWFLPVIKGAGVAGLGYLAKNYFSNSNGQFAKKEQTPEVK